MVQLTFLAFTALSLSSVFAFPSFLDKKTKCPPTPPTAKVRNGTLSGVYSKEWNQDFFLGIPYAQPPVGPLRFETSKPLNTSWKGEKQATKYGYRCFGLADQYSDPSIIQNEDCLTINVIRPAGIPKNKKLPVFVWVHGGGLVEGGSGNPYYNLTFNVDQSVKMGKPLIAVSFNYRLTGFGFLSGTKQAALGNTNMGHRDQRLALHWIQENIAAFGGDPKKVVAGGESAGAFSLGVHALAYGGRDDKLFRGLIFDSGAPLLGGRYGSIPEHDNALETLAAYAGCGNATDSLQCLKEVPFDPLTKAIEKIESERGSSSFIPIIDGDLIREPGSSQLNRGKFVKVPIMIGTTTDEGCLYGPLNINSDLELAYGMKLLGAPYVTDEIVADLLALYPDDPVRGIPGGSPERYPPPWGSQFKRASAIIGDWIFIAGKRFAAKQWSLYGQPVYAWRFDVPPLFPPFAPEQGVSHASDQPFVFYNTYGVGYEHNFLAPADPKVREHYLYIAKIMSRSFLSFAHDLTPNNHGIRGHPKWPAYTPILGQNFVFPRNRSTYLEPDSFRSREIQWWINKAPELGH